MSIIVTGVLSFGVFCGLTYIGVKICQLACFTLPQQQQPCTQQQQQYTITKEQYDDYIHLQNTLPKYTGEILPPPPAYIVGETPRPPLMGQAPRPPLMGKL